MRETSSGLFALVVGLGVALSVFACSSSSGGSPTGQPCNENPSECPAGQTCWPKDASTFACLNSGAGKAGDACEDTVGIPTCGDGLACLALGPAGGACTMYCDDTNPSHACPEGQTCRTASLVGIGGTQFQVCVGTTTGTALGDAGETNAPEAGAIAEGGPLASDGSVPAQCTAWANHVVTACPGMSAASTISECKQSESLYPPEGCGPAWEAYVTCATQAQYDCASGGPMGCDTQQNGYFSCQSAFVSRTDCDRIGSDSMCSAAAPYAFGCLSSLPSGCVSVPTGSAATIACCPAFPTQ